MTQNVNAVVLVHGSNLKQKETHRTKYRDEQSRMYLIEIRERYDAWHQANMTLLGPKAAPSADDSEIIARRVQLFEEYKSFLDQKHYAEKFDSRSNLHSSVLEEFLYYVFKDLVSEFGEHALIGKSHSFKDIFFAPPSYAEMMKIPYARIEEKDHDFVIGATIYAFFKSGLPGIRADQQNLEELDQLELDVTPTSEPVTGEITIVAEKPIDYDVSTITKTRNGEIQAEKFDVPAIAIECKTYLDKTMLEGSSKAAEDLKARNPNAMYIVVMERLKLTESVNLKKFKVDQIYVLRKQKNTDREFRYDSNYQSKPIHVDVVEALYNTVRNHLTADWATSIEEGLQRGWLI